MSTVVTPPDPQRFPIGTTVTAYPRSNFPATPPVPAGAPVGDEADEADVVSPGTVTFTELEYGTSYVAYALVSAQHRYFLFSTGAAPAVVPEVTGSRDGNEALASLLTALAGAGVITDSTDE